jgi:ABC-type multidrug transport system ATPase subunit
LVAVENISKSYGRATAVAGVTLSLWAGEIWGFVGANGAGKTTTLRMLAGILTPDGGAGHVLGFDLRRDAAKIRERVGYMSQRLSLYAELSVFENLRFRAEVYGLKNPHVEIEAAIREFGLVPWAHSLAGSLSGGWERRLQLAASLLHSPRLVLLDEPTAGLDAAARQEVWRRVEALAATGAGVIVCTHDLVEAERCSQIALFADGQVVATGAPPRRLPPPRPPLYSNCRAPTCGYSPTTSPPSPASSLPIRRVRVCASLPIRARSSTCAASRRCTPQASPEQGHDSRTLSSGGPSRWAGVRHEAPYPGVGGGTARQTHNGRRPH